MLNDSLKALKEWCLGKFQPRGAYLTEADVRGIRTNVSSLKTRVDNTIPLSGSNDITGPLTPASDMSANLGDRQKRWNTVWAGVAYCPMVFSEAVTVSDQVIINKCILHTINATHVDSQVPDRTYICSESGLGVSGNSGILFAQEDGEFDEITSWIARVTADGDFAITSYAGLDTQIRITADEECEVRNLLPFLNNNYTLGNATYRWKEIYAVNPTISTSDKRLKTDIKAYSDDFTEQFIMGLKPVQFKWAENGDRPHFGLIAQDVEETLASCGLTTDDFGGITVSKIDKDSIKKKSGQEQASDSIAGQLDEVYGLRYEEFISPLIRMVQIQQGQIEELKRQLAELKTQLHQ